MRIINQLGKILKIDDLKFESSDRSSSIFSIEEKKIDLKKESKKSDIEKFVERLICFGHLSIIL